MEQDNGRDESGTQSDDEIFEELERDIDEDFDFGALREKRLEELKQEMARMTEMREQMHGTLSEIVDEKEVIQTSAKEKRCVIHFYHSNFRRCEIMDKHLAKLAPKYFSTRFLRVFVESVPWLVEKLGIKVLPCVICFIDGLTKDRIIGFEGLGNGDTFETAELEHRLLISGVIVNTRDGGSEIYKRINSTNNLKNVNGASSDSE